MANNDAIENYKKLKKQGIIDEGGDADFSEGSDLDSFLKRKFLTILNFEFRDFLENLKKVIHRIITFLLK